MAQSDVILLVDVGYGEPNEYGVRPQVETSRRVYCKVNSATQSEFFGGGRNGLNPAYRFEVFDADYRGEALVEYRGERYAVYRTYLHAGTHRLELHTERKGGTNGAKDAGGQAVQ